MLRYGEQYVDKGLKYYEEKYREHEIRSIQKKAKDLGLAVTLSPAAGAYMKFLRRSPQRSYRTVRSGGTISGNARTGSLCHSLRFDCRY
jgi:hypothetical protein